MDERSPGVLRGRVAHLRHTTGVHTSSNMIWGSDTTSTSLAYIAIFELDGQAVKYTADEPPILKEGDMVAVAGRVHRGLFEAVAYRNLTTRVAGSVEYRSYLTGGVGLLLLPFVVAGALLLSLTPRERSSVMPWLMLAGVVVMGMGVLVLREWSKVHRAVKALERAEALHTNDVARPPYRARS